MTLTNHDGDQQPGDPLLLHLLDARLVSRGDGFAHDRQGIDVGHGANGGGGHPRQAEESRAAAEDDDEQQVQVETRTLQQHPLLLTDDEPEGEKRRRVYLENQILMQTRKPEAAK